MPGTLPAMRLALALLAAAIGLTGNGEAQLLPAGKFAARDGRPGTGKQWEVSDAQGVALAASINAIAAKTPIVIDYDHQTIRAEKNGAPAPAAGWILSTEWRKGEGLFAKVRWTDAAKAHIDAGEYRYISPVILADEATGAVTNVLLAALVNHPAIVGMEPAIAQLSAQLNAPHQETHDMALLAALIAALGIPSAATEAEALAAVTTLKATAVAAGAKPNVPQALSAALGLQSDADEAAALAAVGKLKGGDPTTMQTIQALQGQIAQLSAQVQGDKVGKAVDDAIAAHKLLPAQKEWALQLGRSNFEQLSAFITSAPVIPGLTGQSGGREPGDLTGAQALSTSQLAIATQLGLDPAKYAEQLKAQA